MRECRGGMQPFYLPHASLSAACLGPRWLRGPEGRMREESILQQEVCASAESCLKATAFTVAQLHQAVCAGQQQGGVLLLLLHCLLLAKDAALREAFPTFAACTCQHACTPCPCAVVARNAAKCVQKLVSLSKHGVCMAAGCRPTVCGLGRPS